MRFWNWILWMFRPIGMNHYCRGESGRGEWSCRSEIPSICHYCGQTNDALIAEHRNTPTEPSADKPKGDA